jgi:hypothetical protein
MELTLDLTDVDNSCVVAQAAMMNIAATTKTDAVFRQFIVSPPVRLVLWFFVGSSTFLFPKDVKHILPVET